MKHQQQCQQQHYNNNNNNNDDDDISEWDTASIIYFKSFHHTAISYHQQNVTAGK